MSNSDTRVEKSETQKLLRIRVSLGMLQREVWAECAFDAADKCGLSSGEIERATFELLPDEKHE